MAYYLYINSSDSDMTFTIKNTPGFITSTIMYNSDMCQIISYKLYNSMLNLTQQVATLPLKVFDKHNQPRLLLNDERIDIMSTLNEGGFVDTELYVFNSCDELYRQSYYLVIDQSIDYATQRTAEITEYKTTKTLKRSLVQTATNNRSYPRLSEMVTFDTTLSPDEILHLTIKELIMYINCNIYNTKVCIFKGLRLI